MKNFKNPTDAEVRRNFPGGWAGDAANKFTAAGRSKSENEAFEFVKKLANYRKNTPALYAGKLTQFVPRNDIYVYFRHNASKTVMVVINSSKTETNLETGRFAERMKGFTSAKDVLSDEKINNLSTLKIPAMSALVLELQ